MEWVEYHSLACDMAIVASWEGWSQGIPDIHDIRWNKLRTTLRNACRTIKRESWQLQPDLVCVIGERVGKVESGNSQEYFREFIYFLGLGQVQNWQAIRKRLAGSTLCSNWDTINSELSL